MTKKETFVYFVKHYCFTNIIAHISVQSLVNTTPHTLGLLLIQHTHHAFPICYLANTVSHTSSPGILPVEKTLRFRKCQVKQKKMDGSESVK